MKKDSTLFDNNIKNDIINYLKSNKLLEIKFNRPFMISVVLYDSDNKNYFFENHLATGVIHDGTIITNNNQLIMPNEIDILHLDYVLDKLLSNDYTIVDSVIEH